jgi:hypothetical protein
MKINVSSPSSLCSLNGSDGGRIILFQLRFVPSSFTRKAEVLSVWTQFIVSRITPDCRQPIELRTLDKSLCP